MSDNTLLFNVVDTDQNIEDLNLHGTDIFNRFVYLQLQVRHDLFVINVVYIKPSTINVLHEANECKNKYPIQAIPFSYNMYNVSTLFLLKMLVASLNPGFKMFYSIKECQKLFVYSKSTYILQANHNTLNLRFFIKLYSSIVYFSQY